jgi:hypothetical protein
MAGVSTGMVPEGDRVWSGQVLQRQGVVRRQCGASGREEPHDGRGGRYHKLQLDENEQGECVCLYARTYVRMNAWYVYPSTTELQTCYVKQALQRIHGDHHNTVKSDWLID